MSWIYCNPNPKKKLVGDCVIRGVAILTGLTWDEAYDDIVTQGKIEKDMPSANAVLAEYMKLNGYTRKVLPDMCPNCYDVRTFCEEHPYGRYLLATGSHVVAAIDGDYYDAWDSGNEVPIYYWEKGW